MYERILSEVKLRGMNMIHIYAGEGKGKTTAAVGLTVRGIGNNISVIFAQFMKNGNSGEINMLKENFQIDFIFPEQDFGFYNQSTMENKDLIIIENEKVLNKVTNQIEKLLEKTSNDHNSINSINGMVVLDEIINVCHYNLIDKTFVLDFLKKYGQQFEIILTGRYASKELIDLADYVTIMKKEKHPFDKNIMARKGIEI